MIYMEVIFKTKAYYDDLGTIIRKQEAGSRKQLFVFKTVKNKLL